MKSNKTSRTAQYMALFRALETRRKASDRLFADPYAVHFLDVRLRLATYASKIPAFRKYIKKTIQQKIPGALSSGLARTKYIDDLLHTTIAGGVQQVMILGAGFDTRGLRLDFLKNIPVIEIDHPNTSNFKKKTFRNRIGKLPANITYCQIDFNKQSLDELAEQYQFDFTRPVAIIWEGVTNYLTDEAITNTFRFISKFPVNSYIIFTYVHRQLLEEPALFTGGERLLKDLDDLEEKWTFGFLPHQLPDFLQQFDFSLLEDLGATDYRKKYLPSRNEKGYEFYRVAIARKNN